LTFSVLMVYHLVVVGWLACFNDPQSYVGGGFGLWQVQPCSTGLGGGARLNDAPWSSRLGVVHWANDPFT